MATNSTGCHRTTGLPTAGVAWVSGRDYAILWLRPRDLGQVGQELGARQHQVSDRDVDDHRGLVREGLRQQGRKVQGVSRPEANGAKRLGVLDQVRVVQVRLVGPAKEVIEVAGNIAIGVVPERDGNCVDALLDRRGELGRVEHEAAIADEADHRGVRPRDLRAQGRGECVPEVEREARVYVCSRLVHLVVGAGVVAELGDVPNRDGLSGILFLMVSRMAY